MAQLTEADHVLAALLALLSLCLAFQRHPNGPDLRRLFYIAGTLTGTGIAAIVLILWSISGRSIADLGLRDWWGDPAVAIAASAGWAAALLIVLAAIAKGAFRERLRPLYRRYEDYMPRTRGQLAASWLTATAAAVGEEIAYRGFLLWYGTMLAGLPLSFIGTSLLFGIAHGYQSRWGILFATIMGLLLGALYLASASLLLVIWVHATYNMASFTTGLVLLRDESTSG